MDLIVLAIGIIFLFTTIIVFKFNGFLSLLLASVLVGFLQGMSMTDVISAIETGMGSTLGHLGVIIGLGAILGKFLSESGAAQRIAMTLVDKFGAKHVAWAIALTSFLIGITLFWEVSFILLIPIVFTVAIAANIRLLKVCMPMLAAITTTHCFLPPHPGPTAVVDIFGANLSLTLVYGIIIAIPVVIISGIFFPRLFDKWNPEIPHHLVSTKIFEEDEMPGFGVSVFCALVPVILIAASLVAVNFCPEGSTAYKIISFLGNADVALLISVFVALYLLGLRKKKRSIGQMMKQVDGSLLALGGILFIIGGGGAFKQVILDSGMSEHIGEMLSGLSISPLITAWLIACIIRLAVGSATVTVFTTSAIVLPLLATTGVSPELMVLAVGAGSVFVDPPTDACFWMVKEFLNLNMMQTLKAWCGLMTLISVLGLIGVLILNLFV